MKRIKELLTRRILLEAGAWLGGAMLLFWWLLPKLGQLIVDCWEGDIGFISYAIQG